ncbi:MAG: post-transcriptional regulator [Bacilli bacterium]
MDITFNSVEELYIRVKPALITKKQEMKRNSFEYVKEEDIWNYLKENKWKNSKNLSLYEMTDNILNADNFLIDAYLRNKLSRQTRNVYFD